MHIGPEPAAISRATPPRPGLDTLPPELRLRLFDYLDTVDVVRMERVSQRWRAAAKRHFERLQPGLLPRPHADVPELKRVLCDRDAMATSLFPPHRREPVEGLDGQAVRVARRAAKGGFHATALVAWAHAGAAARATLENRRTIAQVLLAADQPAAALPYVLGVLREDSDSAMSLVPPLLASGCGTDAFDSVFSLWAPPSEDVQGLIEHAVFAEQLDVGIYLLDRFQVRPEDPDWILSWAANRGSVALVRRVVDAAAAEAREDALADAAVGGHVEVVRLLLEAGAPRPSYGHGRLTRNNVTPLLHCCHNAEVVASSILCPAVSS
ncbi:MAG TPA: F-box protein [Myxococcota bacterium]|nr:F-box protein [Myxococcota bacterium]